MSEKVELVVSNEQVDELLLWLRERCDKPAYGMGLCIGAMFACAEMLDMDKNEILEMVSSYQEHHEGLQ
jgi:hypothetical protein